MILSFSMLWCLIFNTSFFAKCQLYSYTQLCEGRAHCMLCVQFCLTLYGQVRSEKWLRGRVQCSSDCGLSLAAWKRGCGHDILKMYYGELEKYWPLLARILMFCSETTCWPISYCLGFFTSWKREYVPLLITSEILAAFQTGIPSNQRFKRYRRFRAGVSAMSDMTNHGWFLQQLRDASGISALILS